MVGPGRGSYTVATTYKYVGAGNGDLDPYGDAGNGAGNGNKPKMPARICIYSSLAATFLLCLLFWVFYDFYKAELVHPHFHNIHGSPHPSAKVALPPARADSHLRGGTNSQFDFDCSLTAGWMVEWSVSKMMWCCENKQLGCLDSEHGIHRQKVETPAPSFVAKEG